MRTQEKQDEKMWGPLVIIILCIAGLLLLFSLFSPYLFTRITDKVDYQFNEHTGVIGDTFGIMNPFIGLIGILLTFLAFYMQIKANQLQRDQFKASIREDKALFLRNEKIEAYNSLELLSVSLDSVIKDIGEKGEKINEYEKNLRDKPYNSHILKRTPSRDYSRILEINREAIFKSFRFFANSNTENFNKLYNLLDFLPEFFQDFYPRVTNYIKESFEDKMSLRKQILEFLDENAALLVIYKQELGADYLMNENAALANETINRNYKIIEKNYDDSGNPISETDWEEIDLELLKFFITESLVLKDKNLLDPRSIPVIAKASNIRKDILLLKQRALEFADEVKFQYDNLFTDNPKNLSVESILIKIEEELKGYLIFAKENIKDFYNI